MYHNSIPIHRRFGTAEVQLVLPHVLRLALGRERPITFCLDTKSNKKIKIEKGFLPQGLRMAPLFCQARAS